MQNQHYTPVRRFYAKVGFMSLIISPLFIAIMIIQHVALTHCAL